MHLFLGVLFVVCCKNNERTIPKKTAIDAQFNTKKMKVQYAYTIMYVKDVPQTIQFYKEAFGLEQKFLTPENDYGELLSGATTLAFANLELGRSNFKSGFEESVLDQKPFGIELAFTTNDVEKVMESAIKHGAVLFEPAIIKPWGQKVGYVRDTNGFLIEICTPMQTQ